MIVINDPPHPEEFTIASNNVTLRQLWFVSAVQPLIVANKIYGIDNSPWRA